MNRSHPEREVKPVGEIIDEFAELANRKSQELESIRDEVIEKQRKVISEQDVIIKLLKSKVKNLEQAYVATHWKRWTISEIPADWKSLPTNISHSFESAPTENGFSYSLRVILFPTGIRSGLNTHLSVGVKLEDNPNIPYLEWPADLEVRFCISRPNSLETGKPTTIRTKFVLGDRAAKRPGGDSTAASFIRDGFIVDRFLPIGDIESYISRTNCLVIHVSAVQCSRPHCLDGCSP